MTAKKKAAKPPTGKAVKSGAKSGKVVPGAFTGADDPRRGRGPAKGAPNAGRPPDEFKAMMRVLASRDEHLERLHEILGGRIPVTINGETAMVPVDSDTYLKALAFAADRGYGKAQANVDITSAGQPITVVSGVPEAE